MEYDVYYKGRKIPNLSDYVSRSEFDAVVGNISGILDEILYGGVSIKIPFFVSSPEPVRTIIRGDDVLVCFPSGNASKKAYYSYDGFSFFETQLPTSVKITTGAYGNNMYVAAQESGILMYSEDGISWNLSSNTMSNVSAIVYGGGRFVCATKNSNAFWYSDDGIVWQTAGVSTTYGAIALTYGKDKFISSVAYDVKYLWYSYDGLNWSTTSIDSSSTRRYFYIIYLKDRYMAVTNDGYSAVSFDGITWESGQRITTANLYGMCSLDEVAFFSISNNVYVSDDLMKWAPLNISAGSIFQMIRNDGVYETPATNQILCIPEFYIRGVLNDDNS